MTGKPRVSDDGVVGVNDVVEYIAAPFVLEPGHQLRGLRCLLCGMLIGGRPVRVAIVNDMRQPPTRTGGVWTAGFLVCAEHEDGSQPDVMTPALARFGVAVTGRPL